MTWVSDLVDALSELRQGWAGPDTVPPSAQMLSDFAAVTRLLPSNISAPKVTEVDPDDGTITLHWIWCGHTKGAALVFTGKGKVIGCKQGERYKPWKMRVTDALLPTKLTEMDIPHDPSAD